MLSGYDRQGVSFRWTGTGEAYATHGSCDTGFDFPRLMQVLPCFYALSTREACIRNLFFALPLAFLICGLAAQARLPTMIANIY